MPDTKSHPTLATKQNPTWFHGKQRRDFFMKDIPSMPYSTNVTLDGLGGQTWFSIRFKRSVLLTRHGQARMEERGILLQMVADMIETGEITPKNEHNLWISKSYPDRHDNLICAAVALENKVVIKTVMHRWKREERP